MERAGPGSLVALGEWEVSGGGHRDHPRCSQMRSQLSIIH